MWRIVFLASVLGFMACTSPQQPAVRKETASKKNTDTTLTLPYYNTPDFTPLFINAAEAETKVNHQISDFSFTNQHDQKVTQQTIAGKVHVADFFFTTCGSICPRMTNNMKSIAAAFSGDSNFVILSYSVTPWHDSVSVLNNYANAYGIRSRNWHLITGSKSEIYTLARQSYFAEQDLGYTKDSREFLHTEHFVLIDRNKRIRGIYNGTLQLEIEQLIKDIEVLLKE